MSKQSMRKWLAEHPQDLFGINSYSLDQYGLTVKHARNRVFAEYLATFDIELEAGA
jgi:hypothetical protein